jgi:hypothetical protein
VEQGWTGTGACKNAAECGETDLEGARTPLDLINGHDYDDDSNWQPVVGKAATWHDNDTDKCGDGEEIITCILCTTQTKGSSRPTPCKGTEGLVFELLENGDEGYDANNDKYKVGENDTLEVANVCIPDEKDGKPVVSIAVEAFGYNENLVNIHIGKNIIEIGKDAFYECTSLITVDFAANSQLKAIGESAFIYCDSLESITIPAGVETIGDWAFYYCTSLESITIPASVETIGDLSFSNCTSLKTVTVLATTPPSLGDNAFDNTHAGLVIKVPSGTEDAYQSSWSAYASKISAMAKIQIAKPALTENVIDYDGSSKTVTLTAVNDAAYELGGVYTQTNVGNYTATVTLTNTALYEWTDGTTSVLNLNWKIIDCRVCEFAPCTCGCSHPSYTWQPVPERAADWHDNSISGTAGCNNGEEIETCTLCPQTRGEPRVIPCKGTEGLVLKTFAVYKEWYEDDDDGWGGDWSEYYGADLVGWIVHGNYELAVANVCIPDVHPVDSEPVVAIGVYAFHDDGDNINMITSVHIGKNIIDIGFSAFFNYTSIETVTFAENSNLKTIGESAFFNCTSINSISIPANVTTMGGYVFSGWTSDQTIIVPFADAGSKPNGWDNDWNDMCNAVIQYTE